MDKITNIIIANESLIYKIISKYRNYFELDDLYQVAVMGLIKAYRNYKDDYNTKFTTYAYPYILGEVVKYISEYRLIKTNKESKLLYSKILKAKEVLAQKLMKEPSTYEIALFLELDEKLISEVISSNMMVESLDKILSTEDNNLSLYDKLGFVDSNIENDYLKYALNELTDTEYKLITSRYYQNMSQKEVGGLLGMYQVEVSRYEKKILKKLKNNIIS